MAIIIEFKRHRQAANQPASGNALLAKAIQHLLSGQVEQGLRIAHEFVQTTIGLDALARSTGMSAPGLARMLAARSNPTAYELLYVVHHLQLCADAHVDVVPGIA